MSATKRGIEVLGDVLRRMRNDEQGGYDRVDAHGNFTEAASIGSVSAEELNVLFELAGMPRTRAPSSDARR